MFMWKYKLTLIDLLLSWNCDAHFKMNLSDLLMYEIRLKNWKFKIKALSCVIIIHLLLFHMTILIPKIVVLFESCLNKLNLDEQHAPIA